MDESARRIVEPVLQNLDRALGTSYSAVLYGSAARGEFVEGVSDLNLLLVCERLDAERLRSLGPTMASLRQEGYLPPLLVERQEWARAADVFPIEIADMQNTHETLRGPDPLEGMRVQRGDLRRALEQELRGKLLRLRQAYALHSAEPGHLEGVVAASISSVAALFRVVLTLSGESVPRESPAALAAAGRLIGADIQPVVRLWERKRRQEPACPPELFEGYLAAIGAAIRLVDQFTGGET